MRGVWKAVLTAMVLWFIVSVPVQAEEISEEKLKAEISKRADYGEEERERKWKIISTECEPGGGTVYFVSVYYKIVHTSWDNFTTYHGDVWTVKDGVYKRLFEDVELDNQTGGGLELMEMDGRNFVMIRTKIATDNYRFYEADEGYLYSYRGNEPVCFMQDMIGSHFNKHRQILTLYYTAPLGTYQLGSLNMWNPYRDCAYFFTCENGELRELTGEPCTEEEFMQHALNAEDALEYIELCTAYLPEHEITFYRIPGVGYYVNGVSRGDSEFAGEDIISFYHQLCVSPTLHRQEYIFTGWYGYHYSSWANRAEEEARICEKIAEETGENIAGLLMYEEQEIDCVLVRKGDSPAKLAKMRLGDEKEWKTLYELNRETIGENPSLLQPNMVLKLR